MNGWNRVRFVIGLLVCSVLLGQCTTEVSNRNATVKNGVLDLKEAGLSAGTVIRLSGDWRFYWQQVYDGRQPQLAESQATYLRVPGGWGKKKVAAGDLPNFGHATFHLKILTARKSGVVEAALLIPKVLHSHTIYQQNSLQKEPVLIGGSGQVGTAPESEIPDSRPSLSSLELHEETDVYIQVSSYLSRTNAGIIAVPLLGHEQAILSHDRSGRQLNFTVIGIFFSVGLFMLVFFILRSEEKGPLWLSLFCFTIAIRIICVKRYFNEAFPQIESYELFHRVNYLTMTLAVITYLMFLTHRFPASFKNRLIYGFIAISLFYSFLIATLQSETYSKMLNPFLIVILVLFLVIMFIYLRSLLQNYDGYLLLAFLGSSSIVISGGAEILFWVWWNRELNAIQCGLLFNVLFMGLIGSLSNSRARQESEELSAILIEEVAQRKQVEHDLSRVNRNLEQIVKERTGELEAAYSKLVDNAHKAGMAEIAVNTLHNVGNVLNSLTTSASLIGEKVLKSPLDDYAKANEILKENLHDFVNFIKNDLKAQKLLDYYLELETAFTDTFSGILEELDRLSLKADTIAHIITSQKDMVGTASLVETLDIQDIIEDALEMMPAGFYEENIFISKIYHRIPKIPVQKSKLVHTLVNVLTNAYHVLLNCDPTNRRIAIDVNCDDKQAWIKITDSGTGISKENLDKIFLHGFTTKKRGNGFGLHSSAIYMEEMGGKILAESDGEGQGATMSLIFPLSAAESTILKKQRDSHK